LVLPFSKDMYLQLPGFLTVFFPQHLLLVFFLFALLYRFMPPLTEEITLTIIGVVSASWRTPLMFVIPVVYLGITIVDGVYFGTAKTLGPKLLKLRFFRWLLKPEKISITKKYFAKKGNRIIFVTRFVYGLRDYVKIAAGVVGMRFRNFLFYNGAAALLMISLWITVGYFSSNLLSVESQASRFQQIIGWGLPILALILAFVIGKWVKNDMRRIENELSDSEPDQESA